MKKNLKMIFLATAMAVPLSLFAACGTGAESGSYDSGVVKAFRAVTAGEQVISQTAAANAEDYLVTVVTPTSVCEYSVNAAFEVERATPVVGTVSHTAALAAGLPDGDGTPAAQTDPAETPADPAETPADPAEAASDLERAYAEALRLSGIAREDVTGFDFDRETRKGIDVLKVEIEDAAAEYTYILKADDFSLIESKTELKHTMSEGDTSYISEARAKEIALGAIGIAETDAAQFTLRTVMSGGRRHYRAAFNYQGYRYEADIDALSGDVVKFSMTLIDGSASAPEIAGNITEEEARQIAIGFAFPAGADGKQAVFRKVKLDYEDGRFIYEVEFAADGNEYELDISAADGAILDAEIEKDDGDGRLPQGGQAEKFITRQEAIDAVKAYHGGDLSITDVELETVGKGSGRTYTYEIEAVDGNGKYEYLVDAASGEVTLKELHAAENPAESGLIGEERALEIALEHFTLTAKEVRIDKVKLDEDDGRLIYEVEFQVKSLEYELEIDAKTGRVLDYEVSYD